MSYDWSFIPLYIGLSESSGPHTANTPKLWKLGTVGLPLAGTDLQIEASSGEVSFRVFLLAPLVVFGASVGASVGLLGCCWVVGCWLLVEGREA